MFESLDTEAFEQAISDTSVVRLDVRSIDENSKINDVATIGERIRTVKHKKYYEYQDRSYSTLLP